jgi:hypothetical protein
MNIYIEEKLAQERRREMLRTVEQRHLANVVNARLPARYFAQRVRFGDLLIAIGRELKALQNGG